MGSLAAGFRVFGFWGAGFWVLGSLAAGLKGLGLAFGWLRFWGSLGLRVLGLVFRV